MQSLLQEQYQVVEDFANAQSRLFNVTVESSSSSSLSFESSSSSSGQSNNVTAVAAVVKDWNLCRTNVRTNLMRLQQQQQQQSQQQSSTTTTTTRHYDLLVSEHLSLSRRVVETISKNPSWHANYGIPMSGGERSLETNTAALASLKASIAKLVEVEGS